MMSFFNHRGSSSGQSGHIYGATIVETIFTFLRLHFDLLGYLVLNIKVIPNDVVFRP